jgi:HTH-type transcriptional regulator/antitoxin HigA
MTAVVKIDAKKYGRLLAKALPVAVQTEAQNERMLAEIWKLMSKDSLTPEEQALLVLMSELVERFEERQYRIEPAPPHEVLKMLMEDRGLRQKDLLHIFKSSGISSEVTRGKRAISKSQALHLGDFFHVSPELFLWGPKEATVRTRAPRAKRKPEARGKGAPARRASELPHR